MIPDNVEVDEFLTGKRREGVLYGLVTFVQKCGDASVALTSGLLLTLIGYQASLEQQSTETLSNLKLIFSVEPCLLVFISFIFLYFYPLTKKI